MSFISLAYYLVYILFAITIVSTIYVIVMENRNPVKSLAWILLLTLMPVFGLVLYVIFGKNFKVRKGATKQETDAIAFGKAEHQNISTEPSLTENNKSISSLATAISGSHIRFHNTLETFTDGASLMDSLMSDIASAEHSILIEYYILEEDRVGAPFIDLLISKARQGVHIYLILDDLGCSKLRRKTAKAIRKVGIHFFTYLDVTFPFLNTTLNYRNHRKLVIIDGLTVYTGGMNIAERYVYGMKWGCWRDTHFKIKGDIADEFVYSFLCDLSDCAGKDEAVRLRSLLSTLTHLSFGNTPLQIVRSGPDMEHRTIMQTYHKLILSAKRYIYIETPYFMPNEAIREALKTAVLSGVDIKIIIPRRTDRGRFVLLSSYSYIEDLTKAGVRFYFYNPGFIHSKMIVSDDEISIAGSANLDFRSLEHNFELNMMIYDRAVVHYHKSIIESDIEQCELLDADRWCKRSKLMRFNEGVARLLSPLL